MGKVCGVRHIRVWAHFSTYWYLGPSAIRLHCVFCALVRLHTVHLTAVNGANAGMDQTLLFYCICAGQVQPLPLVSFVASVSCERQSWLFWVLCRHFLVLLCNPMHICDGTFSLGISAGVGSTLNTCKYFEPLMANCFAQGHQRTFKIGSLSSNTVVMLPGTLTLAGCFSFWLQMPPYLGQLWWNFYLQVTVSLVLCGAVICTQPRGMD
eukprot:SAG31_NODE_3849_length_3818_cov_3.043560_2_plen_209_part_00